MRKAIRRILNGSQTKTQYAGIRIRGGGIYIGDIRTWASQHITSYRNMIKALKSLKIPTQIIHYINGPNEELAIITRGSDKYQLENRINSLTNIVLTAFPNYEIERLTRKDIDRIYSWKRAINTGEVITGFESMVDSQSYKPKGLFKHPIQTSDGYNKILLGNIIDLDEPYYIDIDDLKNHLSCIGATGMGKTTTISTILNQLPREIPYIVLDYHNEYSNILKNVDIVIKPGYTDIGINPLSEDESIEDNASIITDIFTEVYSLTHPQQYLLKSTIEAVYTKYHLVGESKPNLKALVKMIEEYPIKSYSEHETKAALLRRLKPLTTGQPQKIFTGREIDIEEILNKNVVIELGHIYEVSVRKIFGYILLKRIFNIQREAGMKDLSHITVLEEARYLIPTRREYDPPTVAEKILDEIRKFGESIFIITQFPSQIAKAPLKNSSLLIIHRLTGYEDIMHIKNIVSLNEDQIEYMKQLNVGEALVKDSRNPLPFPVEIRRYN